MRVPDAVRREARADRVQHAGRDGAAQRGAVRLVQAQAEGGADVEPGPVRTPHAGYDQRAPAAEVLGELVRGGLLGLGC